MEVNSLNSSLQGIQRGLQNLNKAAQDTAAAGIDGGTGVDAIAEAAVEAKQAEVQVKASVATLKAEGETLGALLDVLA